MGWQSGTVAVIGAGVMGRGIAHVAALAGAETRLIDVSAAQLSEALSTIRRDLATGVERGKVRADEAAAAPNRIATSTDVAEGCADADLIIEAVVERLDVKHDVLRTAESVAAPGAVLATNTSSMSITEIVSALADPTHGVGMHFFNPVPKMRLAELVWGLQTSETTMERADAAARALGKTTVRVRDLPGFATSRLNALLGNEALRMLEESLGTPEDIDRAARLGLNHPMGPLEMGDLVGWDTRLDILEYLSSTLGDRFRPTPLHRRLVAAGRYGRKSGQGVYRYDDDARTSDLSDLG